MKKIFLFFGLLLFLNCGSDNSFFDFDEAIHYSIKPEDERSFISSKDETKKQEFYHIFYGVYKYPSSIKDKELIKNLEKFYSIQRKIPNHNIQKLDSIFSQRSYNDTDGEYACEPAYRDIIIFKKSGRIVGLAKICFQCEMHYILGSKIETKHFGQAGEYQALQKIL